MPGAQGRQESSRLGDGRIFNVPDVIPRMGSLTLTGYLNFALFSAHRFVVIATSSMSSVSVLHLAYIAIVITEFRLQYDPETITPLRRSRFLPHSHAVLLLQVVPGLSAVLGDLSKDC